MLNLTQLVGFGAGRQEPPSVQYIAYYSTDSNLTTYTFSSVDFGNPDDRSLVVIGVAGRQGSNISVSSATIGGVSATNVTTSTADNACSGLFAANLTASSGTVTVTLSGGADALTIAVWAIYDLTTFAAQSASSNQGSSISAISTNITTRPNGALIAMAACNNGSVRTFTWSNATENFETLISGGAGNSTCSGASNKTVSGASPLTITATVDGSANNLAVSAAFWE